MKITTKIKGQDYISYDKPNMGQKRILSGMRAKAFEFSDKSVETMTEEQMQEMRRIMTTVELTKIEIVLSAFPKMKLEHIDTMMTEDFDKLFTQVATWINTNGEKIGNEKN